MPSATRSPNRKTSARSLQSECSGRLLPGAGPLSGKPCRAVRSETERSAGSCFVAMLCLLSSGLSVECRIRRGKGSTVGRAERAQNLSRPAHVRPWKRPVASLMLAVRCPLSAFGSPLLDPFSPGNTSVRRNLTNRETLRLRVLGRSLTGPPRPPCPAVALRACAKLV